MNNTTRKNWTAKTYEEIGEFCGVGVDSVKRWAGQGMPSKRSPYKLDKIVQWLRKTGPWRARNAPSNTSDPLLAGPDTPQLERYRAARADLAELEREERKRNLIDREKAHGLFIRAAHVFRSTGESLARAYGPEAAKLFNDGLLEAIGIVDTLVLDDLGIDQP